MRDLFGRQPPAGAGDFLRRDVDMLFEAHQLPVAGARHEGKTRLAGKADHGGVGAQGIAEQTLGTECGGTAFQIPEQCRTDALALPAVIDRQAEFEASGVRLKGVGGFANERLNAIDQHGRDHAETVALADMDEMIEFGSWQLAHGAKEAIVAGAHRERTEVTLQALRVARFDKTHRQRSAAAQPQDIGVSPEIVETKRNHRKAPAGPVRRGRRPPDEATSAWLLVKPAKTAFRPRERCRSRKVRRRADRGHSVRPTGAVRADAAARRGWFR